MSWPLLYVLREQWLGDNRWGDMYLRTEDGKWERICYSYELSWQADDEGKSKNTVSRIRLGQYEMHERSDGDKGWRLQLEKTGHRKYIQVHRAAPNLYIEGCILPVHFRSSDVYRRPQSDPKNKTKSVEFMDKIKKRYNTLKKKSVGKPHIEIAGTLPARFELNPPRNRLV